MLRFTGFDAWRVAVATKMHFDSDSYNAFRFNFKAKNMSPAAFEARRDRYFFEKLSKKLRSIEEVKQYVFANIFFGDNTWIGAMIDDPFIEYRKRIETFTYRFKGDLNTLTKVDKTTLDGLLIPVNGKLPILIQRYMEKDIMAETVIAIDILTGFIKAVDSSISDTLLWPEVRRKLLKASPFVASEIDLDKAKKTLLNHFSGIQTTPVEV